MSMNSNARAMDAILFSNFTSLNVSTHHHLNGFILFTDYINENLNGFKKIKDYDQVSNF